MPIISLRALCFLMALLLPSFAVSDPTEPANPVNDTPAVIVLEPYVELRTGPGRGYPVFHVVEQGRSINILKRRTNWFLIETNDRRTKTGWVSRPEMERTAASIGDTGTVYAQFPGYNNSTQGYWQWTVAGGDFAGANAISSALSYRMTKNIQLQLEATQILGEFSDGKMLNVSIQHHPFPQWRLSPYVEIGAGFLQTQPSATLVQAEDRENNTLLVGAGLNALLAQRFNLFLDYRRHTVLTSRNQNEEIDQWKLGINVSL